MMDGRVEALAKSKIKSGFALGVKRETNLSPGVRPALGLIWAIGTRLGVTGSVPASAKSAFPLVRECPLAAPPAAPNGAEHRAAFAAC